jgi:diacylglycerol kinase family enzyme
VASTGAFGGGAEIADADPGDGLLDVVAVPASGGRAALPRIALAMRRGTVAQLAGVAHARGRAVELDVPGGTAFNVDGEVVRAGPRVRFDVARAAFALVVGR